VGATGEWDEGFIHNEIIIPPWEGPDAHWHMVYGGGDATGNIWHGGHALSDDGLVWSKDPRNPVFGPGNAGTFESRGVHPVGQVVKIGSLYHVIYQGYNNTTWAIGVAGTYDFVNYTRSPLNPLLSVGAPGAWDAGSIENPGVVYNPATGIVDMFYVAPPSFGGNGLGGGEHYKFGLARSTPA
jgi:hypothetical protein